MTRSTTKKTTRFFAFIMVAVLLATCLPLTVFGANEELLPFDSQTTHTTSSILPLKIISSEVETTGFGKGT